MILALALITAGCKKKVAPLSERIAKAWTAESVKHNTTTVYTRGGSTNTVPGYSAFRLTLTAASNAVTYTEFDGTSFTGVWELDGESKLILKNLTPQPTGSGGTLEFSIVSVDDAKLVIKRLTASKKTGDSINEYTLSNP
ncbi:hypothetical protein E0F88_22520 [Dyadobacter psychrotolerans]|uniref:Lipocalin-like domain-containing protein n=2 Tax=Dyadobacter psychrotolerans TaxID=2541721 RepID=A0A4R5DF76_9BACT|nr:hypothetical protein E0F88_22520 [Dyadobacter psychrotolerans]